MKMFHHCRLSFGVVNGATAAGLGRGWLEAVTSIGVRRCAGVGTDAAMTISDCVNLYNCFDCV